MRKTLLALALVTATTMMPSLDESFAAPTAYASTLTTGASLSAGTSVLNSRHKHKKAAKKGLKHNLSNSRHRT